MANTPQARKRIRRNENRAEINGARVSRIRSFVKKVETALATGDRAAAQTALQQAQPELARGVARGVVERPLVGDEACHAHFVASFTHPNRERLRTSDIVSCQAETSSARLYSA